jgi:membrane-bound serine protease (ClpP class)
MDWLIALLVGGFLLVGLECFLPGMIAGIIGALCLVAAVVYAFAVFGVEAGAWTLLGVMAGSIVMMIVWSKYFPRIGMGRRVALNATSEGVTHEAGLEALLGKTGEAITQLRPAGTARVEGRRCDVVTEGGLIEAGTPVKVVAVEGSRVVVRGV